MADNKNDPKSFPRGGSDLVAVNPERIVTLMELAREHYGNRCARCQAKLGNKHKPVVHHRHYRTLGFERPVEDIVLLCRKCHTDLHTRSKAHQLTKADVPFVDPEWAESLKNRRTAAEIIAAWPEGTYNPHIYTRDQLKRFKFVFKLKDGSLKTDFDLYPDLHWATKNAEAQRDVMGYASLESVEEV